MAAMQMDVLFIFISFISFTAVQILLSTYLAVPKRLTQAPPRKQWMFYNIFVSFVHSTISATAVVYCFLNEPGMLADLIGTWTWPAYYLICFSAGYFWHDLLDMTFNDFRQSRSLIVHHIVVCTALSLAVFYQKYFGFAVYSLLMEVNSVFLHSRRLLLFYSFTTSHRLYMINWFLLVVTFVVFRLFTTVWVSYYMLQNWQMLPLIHVFSSTLAMICITVLNFDLIFNLWRSHKREQNKVSSD